MNSKAQSNKELVRHAYEEIGKGNHQPILDALSADVTITAIGSTRMSGTYKGLKQVTEEFIAPVMSSFETPPTVVIDQLIAEGDLVVLIAHGEGGIAKNGVDYNNTYCHAMRVQDGKIVESTEYYDTALADAACIGH